MLYLPFDVDPRKGEFPTLHRQHQESLSSSIAQDCHRVVENCNTGEILVGDFPTVYTTNTALLGKPVVQIMLT